jgi:hypothetical protein
MLVNGPSMFGSVLAVLLVKRVAESMETFLALAAL